jgi:hypothetical protein
MELRAIISDLCNIHESIPNPMVLIIAQHVYDENLIDLAVDKDNLKAVKFLHECPHYTDGCTVLSLKIACTRGRLDILKYIFENNIKMNCIALSMSRASSLSDYVSKDIFKHLLEYAIMSENLEVVSYMLDRGFTCTYTTIYMVAQDGQLEILKLLAERRMFKFNKCVFYLDDFKDPNIRAYLSQPQFKKYIK